MWILVAFACALFTGATDVVAKRLLARSEERIVAWGKLFFALPWLFLGPLMAGWPALSFRFWALVFLMVPLELSAYLLYLRAIRLSPLSLVIPFLAFTPLFTVLTSWLGLGERVSMLGLLGVLSVTSGSYVLQIELASEGWLEPLKAIFRVPGTRFMCLTALLYSVTAPLSKEAVRLSSAWTFPFLYLTVDTLILTRWAHQAAGGAVGLATTLRAQLPLYLFSGVASALAFLTHCAGILLAPVPYFIAIKRFSLLVGVLTGGLLFKEPAFRQRIFGALLMLLGAVLIMLSG